MCKFYVYGYECLWKLRKKTCKCAHTSVVRDAFREYQKAKEEKKQFGIS